MKIILFILPLFIICLYIFLWVLCSYVMVSQAVRRGVRSCVAGVIGTSQPPDIGARNQTQVLQNGASAN